MAIFKNIFELSLSGPQFPLLQTERDVDFQYLLSFYYSKLNNLEMVKYEPVMFGFIGIKMVIVGVIVVRRAQNVPSITINLRSGFFYSFIRSNPKSHICTNHLWLFIGQERRSQHCHLGRKISMIVRCIFLHSQSCEKQDFHRSAQSPHKYASWFNNFQNHL